MQNNSHYSYNVLKFDRDIKENILFNLKQESSTRDYICPRAVVQLTISPNAGSIQQHAFTPLHIHTKPKTSRAAHSKSSPGVSETLSNVRHDSVRPLAKSDVKLMAIPFLYTHARARTLHHRVSENMYTDD